MISYPVYKVVHLFGIFLIFVSLGGVTLHSMNGGSREHPMRKKAAMTHGVGLLIALVGGFGLLARLGVLSPFPLWAALKLVIWLFMGGAIALAYRAKGGIGKMLWWLFPLLGASAAYLAIFKPGS